MKKVYAVQVRKADGSFLPEQTITAEATSAKSAIDVAQAAALAQPAAGGGAEIHYSNCLRVIDIEA